MSNPEKTGESVPSGGNTMKKLLMFAVIVMFAVPLNLSASSHTKGDAHKPMDIVDLAAHTGQFNTLVAALQAADLEVVLRGEGPFTVLAPTDEAFAKLPAGTVDDLLKPENKEKLVAVLTYHVIPGAAYAKDVVKLSSVKTVNGQDVAIKVVDGTAFANSAEIVQTDVEASNGVIHIIDAVLLPQ
jgi:uncharacterized surface protein with fasciclin (FAS1) repeats